QLPADPHYLPTRRASDLLRDGEAVAGARFERIRGTDRDAGVPASDRIAGSLQSRLEHRIEERIDRREEEGDVSLGSGEAQALPRSEEHTSELQSRENLVC